jgi:hypothetical protein
MNPPYEDEIGAHGPMREGLAAHRGRAQLTAALGPAPGEQPLTGAVATRGAISRYETVVLLSPAEVDEAMTLAVDYAPPGS